MSGIAGILRFDGAPVEREQIENLTASMAALGPDEQTHWARGSTALGHCMLRTTPESIEEHQPVISPDNNLVLVWDGRLDNRDELHRDLVAAGISLRNSSDAELVLQSYFIWGEDCPNKLLGDFAFAVWDARQNHLYCARDHMGARPFYYTCNQHFIAFASEEEALLSLSGVSNRPSEKLIARELLPGFGNEVRTYSWLESVTMLLPATWMSMSPDGSMHSKIYWKLEPGEESVYASDAECQEAFLAVFGEAVRCRMRSIGSISAMMSGGLDSASIAAMVKRLLPQMPAQEFHTYSAISDQPETCVESQCILSLTKDLGNHAHFVAVPTFSGMLNVEDLINAGWSKAHPVDNSILLPAMMCLAAQRDGHRVMLHGMGGDFTMYIPGRYIAYLLRARQWRNAWRESWAASRNNTYLRGTSPVLLLLKNAWTACAPAWARRLRLALRKLKSASPKEESIANPDWAKSFESSNSNRSSSLPTETALPGIQQDHIRSMTPPKGHVIGLTGYNRVAGRYAMEYRDPWSDKRVVEFWLRLPLKYKVRNGWTKYLTRCAFAADWQPLVQWRLGKEHLGWNFVHRLMDESDTLISNALEQNPEIFSGYLSTKVISDLREKRRSGKDENDWESLYDAITFALWLKRIGSKDAIKTPNPV
ncbi:MAG: asparagine synthetase B [Gammaproteobacteria bacterium]|nr:asparagine synthetase B [Gammaproteobacteria bacterium]